VRRRKPLSRLFAITMTGLMLTASYTLVFVLIVVILQLWLLTATMNTWLGGDASIVWHGLVVSAGGLALNVGLFGYLGRLERTRKGRTDR
jgi:hypothetical protein